MHPVFWILIMPAYFRYAECLKCYSCDGPADCAYPREELCPQNNECFTVAQNYDIKLNGLRKGCSPTCDRVNIKGKLCRTCKFELCNGKTGLGKAFEKPAALPPRRPFGTCSYDHIGVTDICSSLSYFH
ncbi:unnamed protein product [Cercopithifilaria johnstoni]|uniref:Uncharacterized protein n=1 Tax=Cercopithifilaria johnstoni TaxID=2874296 RepID=A0A8J2MAT8_9BILA|nr:unnamed protein product [Cercopithifilaria johnstoni]